MKKREGGAGVGVHVIDRVKFRGENSSRVVFRARLRPSSAFAFTRFPNANEKKRLHAETR